MAAAIVLFGGGFVGAVTAKPSEESAGIRRVPSSEPKLGRQESGNGRSTGQSTSRGTEATSPQIPVTPPADTRAADTLTELKERGEVDGLASFGTKTIQDKPYEGVSMAVDRGDTYGTPKLPIKTKGRYERLRGVVGISGETDCPRHDASVSITDDQGKQLWGPNRVNFNSPKRFDISIKGLVSVNLVQRSLAPSGGSCLPGLEEADPAWGQVEFVK